MEDEQSGIQLSELQQEIERQLDLRQQRKKKRKKHDMSESSCSDINRDQIEDQVTNQIVVESTFGVIEKCLDNDSNSAENSYSQNSTGIG